MTINDCTKDELKLIIERLTFFQSDKHRLITILNDIEYGRVKDKLEEAEHLSEIANDCRRRYIELLKKYKGKKMIDIPIDEIKKAEQYLEDAEKADKEYRKIIKEIDNYGGKLKGGAKNDD